MCSSCLLWLLALTPPPPQEPLWRETGRCCWAQTPLSLLLLPFHHFQPCQSCWGSENSEFFMSQALAISTPNHGTASCGQELMELKGIHCLQNLQKKIGISSLNPTGFNAVMEGPGSSAQPSIKTGAMGFTYSTGTEFLSSSKS